MSSSYIGIFFGILRPLSRKMRAVEDSYSCIAKSPNFTIRGTYLRPYADPLARKPP